MIKTNYNIIKFVLPCPRRERKKRRHQPSGLMTLWSEATNDRHEMRIARQGRKQLVGRRDKR